MKSLIFILVMLPVVAFGEELPMAWDANPDPDIQGYRIYKAAIISENQSGPFEFLAKVDADTLTFTDTLEPDESAVYTVYAFDNSGNESRSSNALWYWDRNPPQTVKNVRKESAP